MVDNQESMTIDEFLKRSQEISVIGRLEATDEKSRVKLTLEPSGTSPCCEKSITVSKDAIQEVRAMAPPGGATGRVVEVVLKDTTTFTAAEVFGDHGVATCRCGEDTIATRLAAGATTTVDRCKACGCWYDGVSCRCGSEKTADCASRQSVVWPYVIGVR